MAGRTVIYNSRVVERGWYETTWIMADTTVLIRLHMVIFLWCGETGIVTGRTVVDNAIM